MYNVHTIHTDRLEIHIFMSRHLSDLTAVLSQILWKLNENTHYWTEDLEYSTLILANLYLHI